MPMLFLAGNPGPMTGAGTNTWLIDGEEPTLIDAGVGEPRHIRALADHLAGRSVARVLLTHGHSDHASGVNALRAVWPGAEVWRWAPIDAAARPLREDELVRAGDATLQVIYTPGHAADHVCFWDPAARVLYGGDLVLLGTTVVIPAGRGGSLNAYLRSLRRIDALDPARIMPGHGDIIDRPREAIAYYLRHRQEREEQVRACLAEGLTTVEAIVARLYPGMPDSSLPAARMTIQAHLDKLAEDETAS
jgi:glyoxylase-like metal-dependent hydrolase (beta-lactamase superfamily II)